MRVTELLTKDTIAMDLMANDKNGVIDELVNQLDKAGKLSDVASFKEAIHNRESQSTTGIGEGIAIPHAKVAAVKSPAIAFGKSKEGVDYQSLDIATSSFILYDCSARRWRPNTSRCFS